MKDKILISFLLDQKTNTMAFFEKMKLIFRKFPYLYPQYINNFETISNKVAELDEISEFWERDPVFWKTKKPIVSLGSLFHTGVYGDGALLFRICLNSKSKGMDWLNFAHELSFLLSPSYGYIHVVSEREWFYYDNKSQSQLYQDFQVGAFSKTIVDGFFNLGWANYFGPKYINKIHIEALQQLASRFELTEIGVLFTVTDKLEDVVTRFGEFCKRRESLKQCFMPDMFRSE
jgi:hypothetical protein